MLVLYQGASGVVGGVTGGTTGVGGVDVLGELSGVEGGVGGVGGVRVVVSVCVCVEDSSIFWQLRKLLWLLSRLTVFSY